MKKPYLPILLICCLFSLSTYAQSWKQKIKGEGPNVEHKVDISTITGLALAIPATVHLTQGSSQSIRVEAQQNIYDNIEQKVRNGSWEVKFDKDVKNHKDITIYITLAKLEDLSIGGMGTIKTTNHFKNLNDVDISIGGSGKVVLAADADDISCSIGGQGTVELSGASESVDISIGGKGKVWAMDMETHKCDISSAGSSEVEIHVKDRLNVSMVGSGEINYKGSPKVHSSVIGSGSISKIK